MNLSIVITTYNSERYIKDCIASVLDNMDMFVDYEIIIIDNNSQDKTIELVNQFKNLKIKIISQSKNKGYSASVNKAVSKANFEKILILNPDTVLDENAILELFRASEEPGIGIVGAKLLNPDRTFQVSSRRHFPTLSILFSYIFRLNKIFYRSEIFGRYNYTYLDEDLELPVDSVSGACMIFSKDLFYRAEGFDERFFIYFEDTDFCLKVEEMNFKVLYCPRAKVVHYNNYSDNRDIKNFYFYQSFELFIYKYKKKICLGMFVYYFAKLVKNIFHLKRHLVPIR